MQCTDRGMWLALFTAQLRYSWPAKEGRDDLMYHRGILPGQMRARELDESPHSQSYLRLVTPTSEASSSRREPIFLVQEHRSSRLHYDLRLEMDGVLRSWAVPMTPSLRPGERQIAVEVEEHPLTCAQFPQKISPSQSGGESVEIWDFGRWLPDGNSSAAYALGRLEFTLKGEKLRGRWLLIRMDGSKPKGALLGPQWVLMRRNESEVLRATRELSKKSAGLLHLLPKAAQKHLPLSFTAH